MFIAGRQWRLFVDLSPVADLDYDNPALPVMDLVDDAVVPLADPEAHRASGELLRAGWPGIRSQGSDAGHDPLSLGSWLDPIELLRSRSLDLDAIAGHAA